MTETKNIKHKFRHITKKEAIASVQQSLANITLEGLTPDERVIPLAISFSTGEITIEHAIQEIKSWYKKCDNPPYID